MAARSLGLSYAQSMRYVVLPQAIRRVIPPLLNDFIGLQKDTAIVYIIGIGEAVLAAQNYSTAYTNFTGYTVAAVFFVILTIPLARFTDALIRQRELRERQRRIQLRHVENVSKSFGENQVLTNVSLDVGTHDVVCLIGASGSGKSTLLRCINLLEKVDAGSITVDGQNLTSDKLDVNKLRQQIGIVFQAFNLFPT